MVSILSALCEMLLGAAAGLSQNTEHTNGYRVETNSTHFPADSNPILFTENDINFLTFLSGQRSSQCQNLNNFLNQTNKQKILLIMLLSVILCVSIKSVLLTTHIQQRLQPTIINESFIL